MECYRVGGYGNRERGTFEKVDSEASFVNGSVRDKLEPQAARRALDVIGLLVATVPPDEGAALAVPIAHLQVVIGTAVVAFNLDVRGSISGLPGPNIQKPSERWAVLGAAGA